MATNPELFRRNCSRSLRGMQLVRRRATITGLLALAIVALALGAAPGASAAPADLVGTFRITPGACASAASGSYFRMILPTGNAGGPFVENADATCGDKTYTLLAPGTDGGLVTGTDQPAPSPGFDSKGNSLAVRVMRPVTFFGVKFSASTNAKDLQSGQATKTPVLRQDGGKLSGDLSAFAATWNKQAFNQGSPKPDGSSPGNTSAPTGTFDPATGRYSLTWTSQIVGGPFDKFTGLWHLEGTFVAPAAGATAPTVAAGGTAAPPRSAAGGGSTATTVAGAPQAQAAAPSVTAAPSAAVASRTSRAQQRAALAAAVHDEGFKAPVWLVVVLALAGIGGVVALLVLGPRRREVAS
jgi:hypothetical protein